MASSVKASMLKALKAAMALARAAACSSAVIFEEDMAGYDRWDFCET
jgi:hypothetical protein